MNREIAKTITLGNFALIAVLTRRGDATTGCKSAGCQITVSQHGPVEQYFMGPRCRNCLGANRRPEAISRDARFWFLGAWLRDRGRRQEWFRVRRGTRVDVARSTSRSFGTPKIEGPICFNPPAARSVLPLHAIRGRSWYWPGLTEGRDARPHLKPQLPRRNCLPRNRARCPTCCRRNPTSPIPRRTLVPNMAHLMFHFPNEDRAIGEPTFPSLPSSGSPVQRPRSP